MIKTIVFFMIIFSFKCYSSGIQQIKDILVKDKLIKEEDKNKIDELKRKVEQDNLNFTKENQINKADFLNLVANLWLVKREKILKWDFKKVDYGVNEVFQNLLKKFSTSGLNYKILYLNSDAVVHYGLSMGDSYLLLISKPFIERLDLSKQEIALILFEEYIRLNSNIVEEKLMSHIGDFQVSNLNPIIDKTLLFYDDYILNKGFTFQDQYELVKSVAINIKNDKKVVELYRGLNDKIKNLIILDKSFHGYSKRFPSPDLKEKWLENLIPVEKL